MLILIYLIIATKATEILRHTIDRDTGIITIFFKQYNRETDDLPKATFQTFDADLLYLY